MRIAYIGQAHGTCLHRARALERLGHKVTWVSPWSWLGQSKFVSRWLHHAGGFGVGLLIDQRIYREIKQTNPDLIWVNQGEFIGRNCLSLMRGLGVPIVNRINDDPFGGLGKMRFARFRKAIRLYDLLVFPREVNVVEAQRAGARQVLQVFLSADEIAHAPRALTQEEQHCYSSDVTFIGTWMPERGPFMAELIRRKVPLSIWGDYWQRAPEWRILEPYWRGPGLAHDLSYSAAILAAKLCLGLLSKGNRDLHTTRSFEIPSLGGLLCAQRTSEHLALYEEGVEAVFWNDAGECAEICKDLLADKKRRKEIAQRGHERAMRNKVFNEPIMASIIEKVMGQKQVETTQR